MNAAVRLRISQVLIGLVVFFNLQSAIGLIAAPQEYAPGFELEGIMGEGIIRGIGLLFIMWNVPYMVALINPARYRISLYESVVMQSIALVGEILLLQTIPMIHTTIHASVNRFILFDGAGWVALMLTVWLSRGSGLSQHVNE